MKGRLIQFKRPISGLMAGLFTFTMVSISYPKQAEAQDAASNPEKQYFFIKSESDDIRRHCRWLFDRIEDIRHEAWKKKYALDRRERVHPGVLEGKSCLSCHDGPNDLKKDLDFSPDDSRRLLLPNQVEPGRNNDDNPPVIILDSDRFRRPTPERSPERPPKKPNNPIIKWLQKQSPTSQGDPLKQLEKIFGQGLLMPRDLQDHFNRKPETYKAYLQVQYSFEALKRKIQEYIFSDLSIDFIVAAIDAYLLVVNDKLILDMLVQPMYNPFEHPHKAKYDDLDMKYSLQLTPEIVQKIKAYIADPDTIKKAPQLRDTFLSMVYFAEEDDVLKLGDFRTVMVEAPQGEHLHLLNGRRVQDNTGLRIVNPSPLSLAPARNITHRLLYTDNFRINIELSSYLRENNEEALLQILKLVTTQYLARQLLRVTDYWPEIGSENEAFFEYLSSHFRSFSHKFGQMLINKKHEKEANHNTVLARIVRPLLHMLPTVITKERYIDLASDKNGPYNLRRHFLRRTAEGKITDTKPLEDYVKQGRIIENEQETTKAHLLNRMTEHPYPLRTKTESDRSETARWLKKQLIAIKKKFLNDHLQVIYVGRSLMSPHAVDTFVNRYVAAYEKELSVDVIQSILTVAGSPTAAINSGFQFNKLATRQIPGVVHAVDEIDEQINALLIHEYNRSLSHSVDGLKSNGLIIERNHPNFKLKEPRGYPNLKQTWRFSGALTEEIKSPAPTSKEYWTAKNRADKNGRHFPFKHPSLKPNVLSVNAFLEVKPIPLSQENLAILMSILLEPLGGDLFLLKNGLQKFNKIKVPGKKKSGSDNKPEEADTSPGAKRKWEAEKERRERKENDTSIGAKRIWEAEQSRREREANDTSIGRFRMLEAEQARRERKAKGEGRTTNPKQELKTTYEELMALVQKEIDKPRKELGWAHRYLWYTPTVKWFGSKPSESEREQHEKDKLQETFEKLKKFGSRLEGMNVANLETIDDLFENSEQKIKFYQVKRAVYMLDSQRLLSVPMKTGTGNPNIERKENTFLKHYQTLWRQDGLLKEEVKNFLYYQQLELATFYNTVRREEPKSLHIQNLTNAADFDYGNFAHDAQAKVFIKDDAARKQALADNERILRELRTLEKEILEGERIPYKAYFHPEYFLGYKGLLTNEHTLLMRVKTLRAERKRAYLDKGGKILDEWMKQYLSHLLIRQALVHQDLLIRKNIHKVVNAKSVKDIKDFVLDPFILTQAKLTIKERYPDQVWKVKSYTLIHKDLVNEKSLADKFFHSSAHSTAFWALLAVSLVLLVLPIPGARVASYAISCILLADFGVQIGIELYNAFETIPASIQNKKNFYLSAADSFDEVHQNGVATDRIRGGPGSIQDFEKLYEMLFWRRVIAVGSFALFFVPWARAEIRRGARLFHDSFNLLSAMKIPYYARQFGIEATDEITLPLVRKRMAEKLGITTEELMGMNKKQLTEKASEVFSRGRWTRNKFGWYLSGRHEAEILVSQFNFFRDPIIQQKLWLHTVDMTQQALTTIGVREGVIPTVAEAMEQGQRELNTLIKMRYLPSGAPEFGKLVAKKIINVKQAIKYLENHQTFLKETWYRAHVNEALGKLNLDMAHGMTAETFDAFYVTCHGNAEKMIAWRALRPIYEMTPKHMKQFEKQMAKRAADHPSQEAFRSLKEFYTSIPR